MVKLLSVFIGTSLAIFLCINVIMIMGVFQGNSSQAPVSTIASNTQDEAYLDPFEAFAELHDETSAENLNDIAPAAGATSSQVDEGFGEYFSKTAPTAFMDTIPTENINAIESDEFDL